MPPFVLPPIEFESVPELRKGAVQYGGMVLIAAILLVGAFAVIHTVLAANIASQVSVQNATPTVSAVVLNGGNPITLTANATTTVYINFTVTDNNGCEDVFVNGNVTSTAFRFAVGGTCTPDNQNCYTVSTSTNNCTTGNASANATATVDIYYFAQGTDASSSYSGGHWEAYVAAKDASAATGNATSSGVELNSLTAIDVTPTTINYGNVTAGTDTGATNQVATTTNTGNTTTTLQLRASATLTSGSNSIATSSQHYATSTFTFGGSEQSLTESDVTVTGFSLVPPTSTNAVADPTFWGLDVPAGTPNGTYTGTNVFSSLFQP